MTQPLYIDKTQKNSEPLLDLGPIDIAPLVNILKLQPELWLLDTTRQEKFKVHQQTQSIVLIWSNTPHDRVVNKELMALFRPWVLPFLQQLSSSLGLTDARVYKLMFAKLPGGGKVQPHVDTGLVLRIVHRIHVPVITNHQVVTSIDGHCFSLQAGHIYNFNNTLRHEVHNQSSEDRIHLIIDIQDKSIFNNQYEKYSSGMLG
jgi:hypothetical protein